MEKVRAKLQRIEDTIQAAESAGSLVIHQLEALANFYEVEEIVLARVLRSIRLTHHGEV